MPDSTDTKTSLHGLLPMPLPTDPLPCPVCGKVVHLTHVHEWGTDDGEILDIDYSCETEPDIDSDAWEDWYQGHWGMAYETWLPWKELALRWLNERYHYRDEEPDPR